ncbi:YciE/YciF ferroxidase family protein [Halpernia frigidisoli]|uniref:Ferritin-like metal-binding protein YciE n=1 Tax=Halpernia frigidisoli TaxID=1125876 RepID=A0A1I3DLG5_9FLAO|nr:ferritin-like domain-containing protein [Halpernia frigidisoli]SFH87536.1 Ferritin-like metal-binding protein YciE [Halpernia frigidisoli]
MKTNQKKEESKTEKSDVAGNLRKFFVDALKDIYWAENALVKALPKMFDNATDQKLKSAIKDHLDQTKSHVERLDQVFASMDLKAEGKKCKAMEGLISEGEEILEETEIGAVRDAGIIAASQKIEHYEIATYGTLAAYAKTLNEKTALDLLLRTLGEEKKADALLSTIADTNLNAQAASENFRSDDLTAV